MKSDLTLALIKKYATYLANPVKSFPDKSHQIFAISPSELGTIGIIDTEATGLDEENEILELAIVTYLYNKKTFEILSVTSRYNEFNEPSDLAKITPEITTLTNITPDMVKGKKINWAEVNKIFETCDYLIAHNAQFDSTLISKYLPIKNKVLCSMKLVEWEKFGAPNKKQEILVLHCCEFPYEGHRAIIDVEMLGVLLEKTNVLKEMIDNSSKVTMVIEGFVDAYQESVIKSAITKEGIHGSVFKFRKALHPVTNKETWFYECKNLTRPQAEKVENVFWEMVRTHNPKGEKKIFLDYISQEISVVEKTA